MKNKEYESLLSSMGHSPFITTFFPLHTYKDAALSLDS